MPGRIPEVAAAQPSGHLAVAESEQSRDPGVQRSSSTALDGQKIRRSQKSLVSLTLYPASESSPSGPKSTRRVSPVQKMGEATSFGVDAAERSKPEGNHQTVSEQNEKVLRSASLHNSFSEVSDDEEDCGLDQRRSSSEPRAELKTVRKPFDTTSQQAVPVGLEGEGTEGLPGKSRGHPSHARPQLNDEKVLDLSLKKGCLSHGNRQLVTTSGLSGDPDVQFTTAPASPSSTVNAPISPACTPSTSSSFAVGMSQHKFSYSSFQSSVDVRQDEQHEDFDEALVHADTAVNEAELMKTAVMSKVGVIKASKKRSFAAKLRNSLPRSDSVQWSQDENSSIEASTDRRSQAKKDVVKKKLRTTADRAKRPRKQLPIDDGTSSSEDEEMEMSFNEASETTDSESEASSDEKEEEEEEECGKPESPRKAPVEIDSESSDDEDFSLRNCINCDLTVKEENVLCLVAHIITLHGEEIFLCQASKCRKWEYKASSLIRHVKLCHADEKDQLIEKVNEQKSIVKGLRIPKIKVK